jgi:tetratricopeptide (TPR) repeat protein
LGVAWPLLVLAPSSSLVPLNEAMVEHRVYLASMGVWLALGAGAGRAVWILEAAGIRARIASRVLLAGVLVALALLTVSRNFVWADPVLLWRDAARKAPDVWLPHYALGDALRLGHRCAEAIPAYQWALRLAPRAPVVYTNLGACLMERGRLAEAAEVFGAAVRLEIDPVRAHHNLGVLALAAGDRERALHHFVEAVNRDAHHVPSRRQLAMLYESAFPNRREALRLCQEIRLIDPAAEDAAACVRRNQVHLDAR